MTSDSFNGVISTPSQPSLVNAGRSNSFSAHSDHQKATDFDVPAESNRPCFQTLPLAVKMVSKWGRKWTRMRNCWRLTSQLQREGVGAQLIYDCFLKRLGMSSYSAAEREIRSQDDTFFLINQDSIYVHITWWFTRECVPDSLMWYRIEYRKAAYASAVIPVKKWV